jgi:hypothetical protein
MHTRELARNLLLGLMLMALAVFAITIYSRMSDMLKPIMEVLAR